MHTGTGKMESQQDNTPGSGILSAGVTADHLQPVYLWAEAVMGNHVHSQSLDIIIILIHKPCSENSAWRLKLVFLFRLNQHTVKKYISPDKSAVC